MTIIEHFDAIDRLILSSDFLSKSEMRGHIVAIREQIEAYSQKAEELGDFETRYADLQAKHNKLVAGNRVIDAQSVPIKPSSRHLGGLL